MALQGFTELQFSYDGFKTIAHSTGKKNAITPWVQNAIGAGNFHSLMDRSKIMPLSQWFDGCLLCDKEHEFALATSMIDYDAGITACAGSGTNAGDLANNTKLGVFQAEPSGMTADGKGYQFVWEWGTAYGNGDIKSVCLTRAALAIADLLEATDSDKACTLPPFEKLGGLNLSQSAEGLSYFTIIDYKKSRGYKVGYSSNTLSIEEWLVGTHYLMVNGQAGYPIKQIDSTHEFAGSSLTNFNTSRCSVNYTGDAIRLIWFYGSTIYYVDIDTDTWTMGTVTSHEYSGASFAGTGGIAYKDSFPMKGDYVYLQSADYTKIYKCNLTSTEIVSADNPMNARFGVTTTLGSSVLLPNGDIYWQSRYSQIYGLLLHNDTWYAVRDTAYSGSNTCFSMNASALTVEEEGQDVDVPLGTAVACRNYGIDLYTFHGFISTVNNLGRTYTKNSSMSMRLIYTVSEV